MEINQTKLEEEKFIDGKVFPITLSYDGSISSFTSWISSNKNYVDELLRDHKAILFRNSKFVVSFLDFDTIVDRLDYQGMEYLGGAAVRTQITERVFTANESPPSERIPFHHELAQTPQPPTHLYFFCEIPPSVGGETPILVSSELCDIMYQTHPDFMSKVEKYGVKYIRYMPEYDDPTSAIG